MNSIRVSRTVITAIVIVLALTGCAGQRSVDAFCDTMDEHKQRFLTSTGAAIDDLNSGEGLGILSGSAQMIAALGDLRIMWRELAEVAPEEILSDVEIIRDVQEQQYEAAQNAASDPLGGLAAGLLSGLSTSGSAVRVDEFVRQNCDS